MDGKGILLHNNGTKNDDLCGDTVVVSVFHGRLTFCLPRNDWDFLVEHSFLEESPSMEEVSEEICKRTGISEKDVGIWKDTARFLHESVEAERTELEEVLV